MKKKNNDKIKKNRSKRRAPVLRYTKFHNIPFGVHIFYHFPIKVTIPPILTCLYILLIEVILLILIQSILGTVLVFRICLTSMIRDQFLDHRQIVKTQIKCCRKQCLIWVCTHSFLMGISTKTITVK